MTIYRNRKPLFIERAHEMRQQPNDAEAMVWNALRNRQLRGFKFRRQYAIGNYIADFYCAEAKLVLELDGQSHIGKEGYDANRIAWLESQGLCVLRFTNQDVYESLEELLEVVWRKCVERTAETTRSSSPSPQPSPRSTEERE
jgi:very-short-patch-repair endonuclease